MIIVKIEKILMILGLMGFYSHKVKMYKYNLIKHQKIHIYKGWQK